jgi:hypothetical protein
MKHSSSHACSSRAVQPPPSPRSLSSRQGAQLAPLQACALAGTAHRRTTAAGARTPRPAPAAAAGAPALARGEPTPHEQQLPRGVSTPLFRDKNTQHIGRSQSKRPYKMWRRPLTRRRRLICHRQTVRAPPPDEPPIIRGRARSPPLLRGRGGLIVPPRSLLQGLRQRIEPRARESDAAAYY